MVAGPATEAASPGRDPGLLKLGLRFRIGAAGTSLGLAMSELVDQTVPLSELWGREALVAAERIGSATTPVAAVETLVRTAGERLAAVDSLDAQVAAAVATCASPHLSVAALARSVAITERQLLRRFRLAVGYGPQTLGRVLRFQRFLAAARRPDQTRSSLASLAADAGYVDQAHLTRECRRLADTTPAALLAGEVSAVAEKSDPYKTAPRQPVTLAT